MAKRTGVKLVRLAGVAVAFGALVGVVYGLIRDSVWAGVTYGVVYGIGFTVLMVVGHRSTAMNNLTSRQRKQVRTALRNGEGVSDPQLAPALIEQARTTLATPLTPRNAGIAAGMFLVFGIGVAVADFPGGLVVGLVLVVCALALLAQLITATERRRDLVERSLRATEGRTGVS